MKNCALYTHAFNTGFETKIGGPERGRTADLFVANEALYQLSYRPENFKQTVALIIIQTSKPTSKVR